jgi:hypothetical protein
MEEQSRSMKRDHVPKGPREEAADEGVAVVAAVADPEVAGAAEAVAAAVVVAVPAEADHKAGADEAAVKVFDSTCSFFIQCFLLLN